MNRLLLLVVACCAVIGGYFLVKPHKIANVTVPHVNELEGWHFYTPSSGQFTVSLPALPQYTSDNVNHPSSPEPRRYEMYVAESTDRALYMVSAITYPPSTDLSNHSAIFKSFIDDMLTSNPRNVLVDSTETQFQNEEAMRFNIENDEGTLLSEMFLKGRVLYVLSRLSKSKQDDRNFQAFLSSFQLREKSG